MAVYKGQRTKHGPRVTKDGAIFPVTPSLTLRRYSPLGFNWGAGGAGANQLSLALLLDVAGRQKALDYYLSFKWEYTANWPDQWTMTTLDIEKWIRRRERERTGLQ